MAKEPNYEITLLERASEAIGKLRNDKVLSMELLDVYDDIVEFVEAKKELEGIRSSLQQQSISYGELFALQSLTRFIDEDDVELLEAAGVPEFEQETGLETEELSFITVYMSRDNDVWRWVKNCIDPVYRDTILTEHLYSINLDDEWNEEEEGSIPGHVKEFLTKVRSIMPYAAYFRFAEH